jgi:RNA polymerase sigma-70 factor (ECF subfamily)
VTIPAGQCDLRGGRVAAGDGHDAQSKAIRLARTLCGIDASWPENSGLLAFIEALGALDRYHLFHAARADLLRRLGAAPEAACAYRSALGLTQNAVERAYLERRIAALDLPRCD